MISSGQTTVGSAAVQIGGSSANASILHVANVDNTKTLYLGNSNVGTANGYPLYKLERADFDLQPGEHLYAVSSGDAHVVAWLRQVL